MSEIEVGKEYDVDHRRKGKFRIRVDVVDGPMVQGTITQGEAIYLAEGNKGPGDQIELNMTRPFISLTPAGE